MDWFLRPGATVLIFGGGIYAAYSAFKAERLASGEGRSGGWDLGPAGFFSEQSLQASVPFGRGFSRTGLLIICRVARVTGGSHRYRDH
jgi:hypothetical protein